jgi:hypothetical protein
MARLLVISLLALGSSLFGTLPVQFDIGLPKIQLSSLQPRQASLEVTAFVHNGVQHTSPILAVTAPRWLLMVEDLAISVVLLRPPKLNSSAEGNAVRRHLILRTVEGVEMW